MGSLIFSRHYDASSFGKWKALDIHESRTLEPPRALRLGLKATLVEGIDAKKATKGDIGWRDTRVVKDAAVGQI